jgi:N-acetylneuraminic acid mutarotase
MTTYEDKIYICGGRNESDLNDVYCYDLTTSKWKFKECGGTQPKPKRRHSACFIGGSLVIFGGFDGNVFNDLHVLSCENTFTEIGPSNLSL